MTASLHKSPGLFSVFWPFSIMLSFIENGQINEKGPGDLRRLVVTQTQMKKPSAYTELKNSKGVSYLTGIIEAFVTAN